MAQTTGKLNGTDLLVYVGGTKIYHTKTHSMTVSMDTRDATTKDSAGWTDVLEAALHWGMSGDGLVAQDATYGYADLFDVIIARTAVVVKFSTEETGDVYFQGSAFLVDLPQDADTEESVGFNFTFDGTGQLSKFTGT